ncbi:type II toxin-antitoxin system RelE/ParE family toxin [Brevundimonas staleyi]|uniref:Type II toxin-antitoxin system RelE/ParE family toxin n=1 Tax=Brevundimonas staleyi TaxID=74326 RepID=A0ABW0FQ37_9CAUL
MAKAIWSARATQEFEDLIAYLKQRNPDAAARSASEIQSISRLLARRPFLGRPGSVEGEREFSVSDWHKVFVYRVTPDGIDISSLRDPRMQSRQDDTDA